jgi:hypothetical protein
VPDVIGEGSDYPDPYSHTWQLAGWTTQKLPFPITNDLLVWTIDAGPFTYTSVVESTPGTIVNAGLVKDGLTQLFVMLAFNTNAVMTRYVRLFNTTISPIQGTDTPVRTLTIPRGGSLLVVSEAGEAYSLGLGFSITGATGDQDQTPVNANEVSVFIGYQ